MSLPAERQQAIRATLSAIDDPQERLAVATGWKTTLRPLDPAARVDEHRVPGCVSRVWLVGEVEDGLCRFRMDAESPLVRGLVNLVCGIYDGAAPGEIVAEEPVALDELGLLRNLSPTRQNGIASVRKAIVAFAKSVA